LRRPCLCPRSWIVPLGDLRPSYFRFFVLMAWDSARRCLTMRSRKIFAAGLVAAALVLVVWANSIRESGGLAPIRLYFADPLMLSDRSVGQPVSRTA